MTLPPILFDEAARRKYLARRAASVAAHDFLWQEGAQMLGESLDAIARPLPRVIELSPRTPHLTSLLRQRAGTQEVLEHTVAHDLLPLAENSADAILSNLSLHTTNDLPGLLIQARRTLMPDGLLMMTLPGAQTLMELRQVLAETESALRGGMSPRVAPFIDVREAGNLLQRAGFALPVVDSVTLTVTYPDMFALLRELRGAGESNMLNGRSKHATGRDFFVQAAARYAAQHHDAQGGITASAEIITITAWKPAANQQQPARRGSGTVSFHDAF